MIHISGRKVKVQTGTKSQTVNICTDANIHGVYEYIVRLHPPFITEDTLRQQHFSSIEDLVAYLQHNHYGQVEQTAVRHSVSAPTSLTQERVRPLAPLPGPPVKGLPASSWEQNAKLATEQCIDQFVAEFMEFPYLHRVEHSIHCELFKILSSRKIFSRTYPMGRWMSQPIHKEWPEYIPRPEKGTRRGNFDLCVLAPEHLRSCAFNDFRQGRIRPSIVIEVGLDYDLAHLSQDAAKLKNSGIENSYLVHLVRQDFVDDFAAVEKFLLNCGIRSAYARLTSSRAFYKLLNDSEIKSAAVPFTEPMD
ncbi:MAG: hypothetical protein LAN62_11520 [Acidobacteriia bacterium]|nr:hypothetical protein [Terriglobia bacterium]